MTSADKRMSRALKKPLLTLLLALMCLLLCACGSQEMARTAKVTDVPGVHSQQIDAQAPERIHTDDVVNLYFRFRNEPALAPAKREISCSPTESREMVLLSALLQGPGQQDGDLTGLFPQGVQVLSVATQNGTVFVTLSQQIMNGYSDEPASWASDPAWAQEVPMRRKLCMQSIVATLTENCPECRRVQILVEQSSEDTYESMRLRRSYFMDQDTQSALVGPMTRNESLILSPAQTMENILSLWVSRDWLRLRRYLTEDDDDTVSQLESTAAVVRFTVTGGSITADGSAAVYTVELTTADGQRHTVNMRLARPDGAWLMDISQLQDWQEDQT